MNRFDSLVHATRDGAWLNSKDDASYSRLMRELDRGEIDRACLVGLAGIVDNEYILQCAGTSDGRLVPIAGVDPSQWPPDGTVTERVAALAAAGFAGIKLHPRLHGYDPLAASCLEAIRAAAAHRLVVFLDTLFRQRGRTTAHAADVVDSVSHECEGAPIVLLHAGGPALLEIAEIVRLHPHLTLDLSFTLMRYAGSSLDADLRWVMGRLDQRIVIGSDMPEFTPAETFARAEQLAEGLPADKWRNMAYGNLSHLFSPQPSIRFSGGHAQLL